MEKVLTINITDSSRAIREEMLKQDMKAYQYEDGFQHSIEGLKDVKAQELPEVKCRNKIDKEVVEGFNVFSFSKPDYENIVLYIHGGAWVYELFPNHVTLCDDLVDIVNAKVYAPLYPLAPKYSYKETYKMIVALYDKLIATGKPVFVMGDSAGGNISLGLVHIIKETGRKMPVGLVPLSPCVDMSFENPEASKLEKRDPLDAVYGCKEFAKMWAKGTDLKDPLLSIVNADVSGFPKTLLLAASEDILTPDIMILYEKMKKAGNDITLVKGEGLWHVFPSMDIPERATFLDILKKFCGE